MYTKRVSVQWKDESVWSERPFFTKKAFRSTYSGNNVSLWRCVADLIIRPRNSLVPDSKQARALNMESYQWLYQETGFHLFSFLREISIEIERWFQLCSHSLLHLNKKRLSQYRQFIYSTRKWFRSLHLLWSLLSNTTWSSHPKFTTVNGPLSLCWTRSIVCKEIHAIRYKVTLLFELYKWSRPRKLATKILGKFYFSFSNCFFHTKSSCDGYKKKIHFTAYKYTYILSFDARSHTHRHTFMRGICLRINIKVYA